MRARNVGMATYILRLRYKVDERNRLESEIRAAELALNYYRKALELEQKLVELAADDKGKRRYRQTSGHEC